MIGKGKILIAIILVVAVYFARRGKTEGKIVETLTGSVKGIISVSRDGQPFYEWLGIPYGIVPQRFSSSKKMPKWAGIKDSSEYGAVCPQLEMLTAIFRGEEDCLFLNIHASKSIDNGKKLPVMVWIHGGYFMTGSSNMYRPDYFMDQDVIIVTINYRLGALGFLNTGDGVIRGNMGLKDQSLALKWINENIDRFGGDNQKIVLFGESAGGASTHLHMLSPMSRGLMSKVISQSGTALNPWALNESPKIQAHNFASALGCPTDNSHKLLDCLLKVDLKEFFTKGHAGSLNVFKRKWDIFVPTIETINDEETFLPAHPLKLTPVKIPWLTGFLSSEGLLSSHNFLKNATYRDQVQNNWDSFAESFLYLSNEKERNQKAGKIRDFYFGKDARVDMIGAFRKITNLITDALWIVKGVEVATIHSQDSPTYLFYYNKIDGPSAFPTLLAVEKKYPVIAEIVMARVKSWVNENLLGIPKTNYGASHGDELAMLFYVPLVFHIGPNDAHAPFSRDLVRLWVDFANNHKNLKFRGETFPPLNPQDLKFFEVNDIPGNLEVDERVAKALEFWKNLNKN